MEAELMNKNILIQRGITETEREVLKYLVIGKRNSEIAESLCISTSTVKKHLESIYYKLGVHNRVQAIYLVFVAPGE